MFDLGVFNGSRNSNKKWTVTSPGKKSKHKTRYISEEDYQKYLFKKNNKINI